MNDSRQQQESTAPRDLHTVEQFAGRFPAWSPASLRHLLLNAKPRTNSKGQIIGGNGLSSAIYRDRRRVLISESGFFRWLAEKQKKATSDAKAAA